MKKLLSILLRIVGLFANDEMYDRLFYDTGLILDCVEIKKEYDINLKWNILLPI